MRTNGIGPWLIPIFAAILSLLFGACATGPDGFGTQIFSNVEAATAAIVAQARLDMTPEHERIRIASTVAAASYLASRNAGLDKNVAAIGAWKAVAKMSKLMNIDMADYVRAQISTTVSCSDAEIYTALIRAGLAAPSS